jgi:hypothetical protein
MIRALALLALPTLVLTLGLGAEDPRAQDRKLVERAALDYVEAFCEAKPELLERSVDPKLDKLGFHRQRNSTEYIFKTMSFEQAIDLAKTLKSEGYVPAGATHKIEILDLMDKTAAVKVEAFWGVDYMHLIKEQDAWKIRHVVWQSAPAKAAEQKQ